MIYLQRSNPKNKSKVQRTIIAGIITLICIILLRWAFPQGLGNALDQVATPFLKADNASSGFFSKFVMFIKSRNTIIDENRSLKERLEMQEKDIVYLSTLQEEYDVLMEMYGRHTEQERVIASVLKSPPRTPYDTLIVDVGMKENVSEGNIVIGNGSVALGSISTAQDQTSKVLLFSSSGVKVGAFVGQSTSTPIMLTGRGGGSFEADVPQDTDIAVGDVLILPGVPLSIIGTVVEIDSDVQNSFKKVFVRAALNFNSIRFVEIIKGSMFIGE